MTTIIAIEVAQGAAIAADGRISTYDSTGHSTQIGELHDTTKIHHTPHYTIATAGDLRAINIINHALQPPPPPKNATPDKLYKYLITKFIPHLQQTFNNHNYSIIPTNSEQTQSAEHYSTILIAIQGKVFYIEGDYSVMRDKDGIYAIGTGAPYALGHLYTQINKQTTLTQATTHALTALHIAAHYDPHTGRPYTTQTNPTTTPQ